MRLAKYLAHAGVASRRGAERLIAEGRVKVAGEVVLDPARDVSEGSAVSVDDRPVSGPEERVAYIVNKPIGVISTAADTHGRPTVVGLVDEASLPGSASRLYPVGRLDAESSGLILLTNDGDLANRLTHPRYEVPKTYRVRVRGEVSPRSLEALREGVMLEDGRTGPAEVRRAKGGKRGQGRSRRGAEEVLEITIREGRNRQVRRMCASVGLPVLALERIALGPLSLEGLAPGEHRRLGEGEIERLRGLGLRQSPA